MVSIRNYYLISIIFFSLTSQFFAQNYLPLEIGNRWDYLVGVEYPGGYYLDTFSIEIIDQRILSNGIEYFEFSKPFPFCYMFTHYTVLRQ